MALRVREIAGPADQAAALSLVAGVGAIFAMFFNPLAGRLSDRTASRFGQRRPWIIDGFLLAFNQMQLSVTHVNLLAQGLSVNTGALGQSVDRDNEVLTYSRLRDITIQAWSPFRAGWIQGSFLGDREHFADLNDVLEELADTHGSTPTGIVVAWHNRHPARMQTVIGTTKPERVAESAAGTDIRLSREEWYRVFRSAGNTLP